MTAKKHYVICTNPRSGSWLLAEGLEGTGLCGRPREWFNEHEEREFPKRWGIKSPKDDYTEYVERALKEGTGKNGVFGMKCMGYQFGKLPAKLHTISELRDLDIHQMMNALFPDMRYIWLTRNDKERQAISYFRATKTQVWWEIDGAKNKNPEVKEPIFFDGEAIVKLEQGLIHNDNRWKKYFDSYGIKPMVIVYEEFSEHYTETIYRALEHIGIENARSLTIPPTRLKKQSDDNSQDWLLQYQEYKKREGIHLPQTPGANQSKQRQAVATSKSRPVPIATNKIKTAQPEVKNLRPPQQPPVANADIPAERRRWIASQKLLKVSDEDILNGLMRQGMDESLARRALTMVSNNPAFQAAESQHSLLHKRRGFAIIQRQLSALDPTTRTIERRRNLSRAEFLERYYSTNRPVIIEGLMQNWKAMTRWTPEYLKATCGDAVVEIMADRNNDPSYETEEAKHRRNVRFGDFVDMVEASGETNDYYLTARNKFFSQPNVKALLDDIERFPEFIKPTGDWIFMWYGPKGTVTPLHHDLMNIMMAQVKGRKRLKLIPAVEMDLVYNSHSVYSPIDPENPDYDKFPKFREANMLEVDLNPGEVLFIPIGWWHHVRSLDVSITLTLMDFIFPNRFEEHWVHPKRASDA